MTTHPAPHAGADLPPIDRLTLRADYLAANRGRRFATTGFVLLARRRGDGTNAIRLGITVSRKVGNAVHRNRVKRRFRALIRALAPTAGRPGTDYVMIGRAEAHDLPFATLSADLARAFARLDPR